MIIIITVFLNVTCDGDDRRSSSSSGGLDRYDDVISINIIFF
jgi:hypothetical protein